MDIWEQLYEKAKKEYHPTEVSPFITAHHVVCALEAENGEIFTGFCIEGCSGVMNLCAERVAALNMYLNSGQTVVKRLIAFRDKPPCGGGSGMPCGACREFFLQLDERNEDMEILIDYKKRETVTLKEIFPHWWGRERYEAQRSFRLVPAKAIDLHTILQMQIEAFAGLLEKYEDYDTSPANERLSDIARRYRQEGSAYYFISVGRKKVGVIRIVDLQDGSKKRISPLFILPEYCNKGYAQKAIEEAEKLYGADNWQLSTILQEEGNCRLYEKCGYRQTGAIVQNERLQSCRICCIIGLIFF